MKRFITIILIFTILISSIVLDTYYVEATGGEALLLTGAGYSVAYAMLPYALAGVAVAGSVYLTYKIFSNQKVKSIINSWYQSLSEAQRNIFNSKVQDFESSSTLSVDKDFLASVNGLSLVNNIVTASIDDLNSSQLASLGQAYENSIAYGKTIGQLLEGKPSDWDISSYNYKTLILKNGTTLTWFFTDLPIEPIGYNWSTKRIEINAVGQTLTTYKDTSVYFPATFLPYVIYLNLTNDMTNGSICLDVEYPEVIKANPVVMQDVLDVPISLTLDYPINWDIEEPIPLVPPITLEVPRTDTIPWGEAHPDAGQGSNTGDWGIVSGIKDIVSGIKGILDSILSFLASIFEFPDDVTLDFEVLKVSNIKNKFPFSIPFDFYNVIKTFSFSPIPPEFAININANYLKLNHTIDLTLINFVVGFFRYVACLFFIYILISKTRDFIKW